MGLFEKLLNKHNLNEMITSIPEHWSVLNSNNSGRSMIIRKNVGLEKIAGNIHYAMSCGIGFEFLFPDENGFPDLQKEPELHQLEKDVFETYEKDLNAIVAMVITSAGFKEFILYTKDVDEFNLRLEQLKVKYQQYTLTCYNQNDANWTTFKSIK